MFTEQQEKIKRLKEAKLFSVSLWSALKAAIAIPLMIYIDFGIYIVIGYLIFVMEHSAHGRHLNNQELDLQLNILHQKIDGLSKK
jgi:hypothetical protein